MKAFELIQQEMAKQDEKWGKQSHYNHVWLAILIEEIGEIGQAINEGDLDNLEIELVQASAVLIQWIHDKNRKDTD